jgi:hypothetical protein
MAFATGSVFSVKRGIRVAAIPGRDAIEIARDFRIGPFDLYQNGPVNAERRYTFLKWRMARESAQVESLKATTEAWQPSPPLRRRQLRFR